MDNATESEWREIETLSVPDGISEWLKEPASMTQRLEQHCLRVRVEVTFEGYVEAQQVAEECVWLPHSARYWLREITLFGDEAPWLKGRTVLPEESLVNNPAILTLGNTPLGHYLFQHPQLQRHFIQACQQAGLWVRRSGLSVSGYPLMLTEQFLPAAPIYHVGRSA